MAIRKLNLSATEEVISDLDPASTKEDGATVFVIGPFDSRIQAYINDLVSEYALDADAAKDAEDRRKAVEEGGSSGNETIARARLNEAARETFKFGVQEIHNLPDSKGVIIPVERKATFKKGKKYFVIPDETLDEIPMEVISEIAGKIDEMMEVKKEDEKNSDKSSSPVSSTQNETVAAVSSKPRGDATPA